MHEIVTTASIAAPPERVWDVLLDFARYPEWNPFVRCINGTLTEGSTLEVTIRLPGGRTMTFHPVVLSCRVKRELRWKGTFFIRGLCDGEHYFLLQPVGSGSTAFTHGERFTGLLVPWLRRALDRDTRAGFEAMNRALTDRLEH